MGKWYRRSSICLMWDECLVMALRLHFRALQDSSHGDGEGTINTIRKATVAFPTIKRLLIRLIYGMHLHKLLESHEMM